MRKAFGYFWSVLLLAQILLLVACGRVNWNEEVKLSSGDVIVVQRSVKAEVLSEIAGPGGWENRGMRLRIISPKGVQVPTWDFPYVPMVLDRDPVLGAWFVVATFYTCQSWYELGRPKLPYVEFWAIDGKWVMKPISEHSFDREANLLTSIDSRGEPDHTLASKQAVMRDPVIAPKYKRVLRTWSTGC